MNNQLTIAIPKGRILTESIELFGKIGIRLNNMLDDSRKLSLSILSRTCGR